MWQTILMCIAVFDVVWGLALMLMKMVGAISNSINKTNFKYNIFMEIIMITIGISYLIWYCN